MKKRRQHINHNLLTLALRHGYKEMQKMKSKKMRGALLLSILVLIPILISIGNVQPVVENSEVSKVVFFVS